MSTPLNPNSMAARDRAYALHPYANARAIEEHGSLIVTRGDGMYVYDEEGKAYIESVGGLWCSALGFGGEQRLVDAATKALETLPFYHQFGPKAHPNAIELAEKLIGMAPVPMSRVFFCCSGSEANDTALKLVWFYNNVLGRTEKKKVIGRKRGYHGITVAAASMTGVPRNHEMFGLPLEGFLHLTCPHFYRDGLPGESEAQFTARLAKELEDMVDAEGPETIAAFIAEPVMGAGGVVVPPEGYFAAIQPILKKHDILFIVDEVICGFGRTGNPWGSQTFALEPDIITCAKQLTASYLPLSAVMVGDKVYQTVADGSSKLGVFGHGYTYGGHPASCAVGVEALKIYEERDIYGHAAQLTPYFQKRLRELGDHPLVGEVRGLGLIAGVELVADKNTKAAFEPAAGVGAFAVARAQAHGMISRNVGDTLCFSPPMIMTENHVDIIVDTWKVALDETQAHLRAH